MAKAKPTPDDWEVMDENKPADIPTDWEEIGDGDATDPGIVEGEFGFMKMAEKLAQGIGKSAGPVFEPVMKGLRQVDLVTGAPMRAGAAAFDRGEDPFVAAAEQFRAGMPSGVGYGEQLPTTPDSYADVIEPHMKGPPEMRHMASQVLGVGADVLADPLNVVPSGWVLGAGKTAGRIAKGAHRLGGRALLETAKATTLRGVRKFHPEKAMMAVDELPAQKLFAPDWKLYGKSFLGKAAARKAQYLGRDEIANTIVPGSGEVLALEAMKIREMMQRTALHPPNTKKIAGFIDLVAYGPMKPLTPKKQAKAIQQYINDTYMLDVEPGLASASEMQQALKTHDILGDQDRYNDFLDELVAEDPALTEMVEEIGEALGTIDELKATNSLLFEDMKIQHQSLRVALDVETVPENAEVIVAKMAELEAAGQQMAQEYTVASSAAQASMDNFIKEAMYKVNTAPPRDTNIAQLDGILEEIDLLHYTPHGEPKQIRRRFESVQKRARANLVEILDKTPEGKGTELLDKRHDIHLLHLAQPKRSQLTEGRSAMLGAGGIGLLMHPNELLNATGIFSIMAGYAIRPKTYMELLAISKIPEDAVKGLAAAHRSGKMGRMAQATFTAMEKYPKSTERFFRLLAISSGKPAFNQELTPEETKDLGKIRETDPEAVESELQRLFKDDSIPDVDKARKVNFINKHGYFISDEEPDQYAGLEKWDTSKALTGMGGQVPALTRMKAMFEQTGNEMAEGFGGLGYPNLGAAAATPFGVASDVIDDTGGGVAMSVTPVPPGMLKAVGKLLEKWKGKLSTEGFKKFEEFVSHMMDKEANFITRDTLSEMVPKEANYIWHQYYPEFMKLHQGSQRLRQEIQDIEKNFEYSVGGNEWGNLKTNPGSEAIHDFFGTLNDFREEAVKTGQRSHGLPSIYGGGGSSKTELYTKKDELVAELKAADKIGGRLAKKTTANDWSDLGTETQEFLLKHLGEIPDDVHGVLVELSRFEKKMATKHDEAERLSGGASETKFWDDYRDFESKMEPELHRIKSELWRLAKKHDIEDKIEEIMDEFDNELTWGG